MAFQLDTSSFMQGANLKQRQQENIFDLIQRGIQNQQNRKRLDILKQKTLNKENDPKAMGTKYILDQLMARGMTREQAAAELLNAQSGGMDPWTGTRKDSIFDALGLGGSRDSYSGGGFANLDTGQGTFTGKPIPNVNGVPNPAATTSYDQIQPDITNDDLVSLGLEEVQGVIDGKPVIKDDLFYDVTQQRPQNDLDASYGSGPVVDPLSERPQYSSNAPKPMQLATEKAIGVDANLSEYAGKKAIDEQMQRRQAAFEKFEGVPQAEKAFLDLVGQHQSVDSSIDKAIDQTNNMSAGFMGMSSVVGGTPAADLEATLSQVQADAAFSTLQAMREASKTGGALGQVSERELSLLINSRAAITQSQSPDQLRENLTKYKEQRKKSLDRVFEAYKKDYGYLPIEEKRKDTEWSIKRVK